MIQIRQSNRSKFSPETNRELRRGMKALLRFVFAAEGADSAGEVSLTLIDDAAMRELNRQYRGLDQPTDVLSFPLDAEPDGTGYRMFGDIVIAVPTASRYAAERGVSPAEEIRGLLVHGALHLLGYTDEDKVSREKMLARQERLLKDFGSGKRVRRPLDEKESKRKS